jgi:(p)ppGpp synthase/HD superfamily hydrolase
VQTREHTEISPPLIEGFPLTEAALQFAAERHEGQVLAGEHAPFVQHPLEVASLLRVAGYPDDVVASGVLHDVLENTGTPAIELEYRFGARVAALVQAVTEDESIDDRRTRKAALRAQVAHSPLEAGAVFAADKISRVRQLRLRLSPGAPLDEAADRVDHYRASLTMLEWRLGHRHRLVEQLRFELEERRP